MIIALIIHTLTMDKLRSIATLELIGAPDRTIIGLIVQEALLLGISGFATGLLLILPFKDYFPRRLLVEPRDVAVLFGVAVAVCLLGSVLGVRAAVKIDLAKAWPVADAPNIPRPQPLVELRGVCKHFGTGGTRADALVDIALTVHAGEAVGLRGPSGSGKSTLLNVIGCVTEPNSGWMQLDGELVYDGRWLRRDLCKLRLDKIGFIFQTHNLLPFLDATENIMIAMELADVASHQARERAEALLDYLGVSHRKNAMPGALSGGEA